MKKKLLFLFAFCLWLTPIKIAAEKVVEKVDENWTEENDRSLPSTPTITIDEQYLYIRSEVQLPNLDVCIQDSRGNIVYSDTLAIQAGGTAMIPVASFNEGEYTLFINRGSKFIIATIIINF